MVYVDELRDWGWRLGPSCHFVTDELDLAELHRVAAAAGLRRAWFQASPPSSSPHYDLTASRRAAAVRSGAVEATDREVMRVLERRRASARAGRDVRSRRRP